MKQGKIWGSTQLIFKNHNFEIHRIEIKANSKCSMHKHNYKYNLFFVESGCITISVEKNDYNLTDMTTLMAGEQTVVPPGENHQFLCRVDSVVYEVYYTEPIGDDIVRKTVGGLFGGEK